MRKIIRRFFIFVLFALLFIMFFEPQSWLEESNKEKYTRLAKGASNKITYLMSEEEWVLFLIPSFATKLKFLCTVNINPKSYLLSEESEIRYSLVYEFLDTKDKVLSRQTHHFRTHFVRFKDENGTFVDKQFYLDTSLHPNSSQSLVLGLQNHRTAYKIRLKIESKDMSVGDIGIRSYYLEPTTPSRRDTLWQRMSKERKQHLARANIYKAEYLTAKEKHQLISSLWKPNGPIGIRGKSYRVRRLFVHPNAKNIHPYIPFVPMIYSDENLSASRILSEGNYSLELSSLSSDTNNININIYEKMFRIYSKNYNIKNKNKNIFNIHIPKEGLLEINSTEPLSILIKQQLVEENQDFLDSPAMLSLDYYYLEDNQSISYSFYHPHTRFIRIECRSHSYIDSTLTLKITDRDANITSQEHNLSFEAYRYDYTKGFISQSKAFYLYMALPSEVQDIEIYSSSDIIIRMSTRSETMIYPIYGFTKESQTDFPRLLPWFTLRPKDFDRAFLIERKRTLYKQPPPPHVNPFIALGRYAYEQLLPIGRWYGHNLLLKRPFGENYIRPQSWSSIYIKLNTQQSNILNLQDDIGRQEVTPHLLYLNHKPQFASGAKPVRISLNDEVVSKQKLYGTSASIPLPTLSLDRNHTFRVLDNTPRDQRDFFINHAKQTSQKEEVYMRRKFILFDRALSFQFTKTHAQESLGFQIASHYEQNLSLLSFRVHIDYQSKFQISSYSSFSFQDYILHANILDQEAVHITHLNKTLTLSSPMYLSIGENLPLGEYNITVCPPKIPYKTYLFINHLILDEKAKTRISKEIL